MGSSVDPLATTRLRSPADPAHLPAESRPDETPPGAVIEELGSERRIPFGFALAFLGLFLPAVMVTSCDGIAAEATVLDLAVGKDAIVRIDEVRDALGSDAVPLHVEPWAIALIILVVAGGAVVAVWGDRHPWWSVPIAITALLSLFVLVESVSSDVAGLLDEGAEFGFAGGGFLIALGLWVAIASRCLLALGEPLSTPFVVVNTLMLIAVGIVGMSALGSDSGDAFSVNEWDIAAGLVVAATAVTLVQWGLIAAWRARTT